MSITEKMDNISDKVEPVVCMYEDNTNEDKSPEEDNQQAVASTSYRTDLVAENLCSSTSKDKERSEQGEVVNGNRVTDNVVTKIQKVQVKDEDPDNKVWCMDQDNELRSKSPISKSTQKPQSENEEMPGVSAGSTTDTGESVGQWRHLEDHSYAKPYSDDQEPPTLNNVPDASVCTCNDRKTRNKKSSKRAKNKKSFSKKDESTSQAPTYSKTKPFQCNVCVKDFGSKINLKKHHRSHISKPYKCCVCKKRYINTYYFKKHMRKHVRPQPYKCQFSVTLL